MTIAKQLERDGHVRYSPASGGGALAITGNGIKYAQYKCLKVA